MSHSSALPLHLRRAFAWGLLAACMAGPSDPLTAQASRDYISIVGSSTVYPFATVVAEQFGRATRFRTPTIESTGSGGGLQQFCGGIGVRYPDIANASRRIRTSEVELCARNGVTEIVEVKIGYDGIVLANDKEAVPYSLTTRDIFLALAKRVPNPSGSDLIANPYQRWSDVRADLPSVEIEVLGPPPTSGTRDAFLELIMEPGCAQIPEIDALEGAARQSACFELREDRRFIEAGENDNLIVQKLQANPSSLGIFGFSFLDQNADQVKGARIDGVEPSFDSISDGSYPVSRPLYFYVKSAHVGSIPGLREYLNEFTSEAAAGEFGYLSDKGLIPLPEDERVRVAKQVSSLSSLDRSDLAH